MAKVHKQKDPSLDTTHQSKQSILRDLANSDKKCKSEIASRAESYLQSSTDTPAELKRRLTSLNQVA
ncbi:hypothetical protein [Francisella tularensis]|uniref:hypothetical protein n=1 Tax=Francisella tularensis TaxID=263 RepID=UPI002381A7F5|nr:hypothetical protein [Francisella tularensis]MDE5031986.1 hypothetical protein [Francisella tularensis subsp. holarctica]